MNEQIISLLQQAQGVFATTAAFLTIWKASLPPDRRAEVTGYEAKGLRIGISVNKPRDRFVIQVFMLDPAGETVVLDDEIEQAGPLPSIN